MQLLYEEDGELKVGAVLGEAPASFQVESPHGRRSKIKAASVLLSFERPVRRGAPRRGATSSPTGSISPSSGNAAARASSASASLARDYVGREPTPVEAAGVLLKLHSAPMYFYRRGKGRFQAAPRGDAQARARRRWRRKSACRRRIAAWAARLARFDCPPEIAALKDELLYAPDRNKAETKAFEQACKRDRAHPRAALRALRPARRRARLPPAALPARVLPARRALSGARGAGAPPWTCRSPRCAPSAWTTSARPRSTTRSRCSACGEASCASASTSPPRRSASRPGSPLDAIARERLSTAYMPGRKFTMLPDDVIERFSLDHGGERPAVSLYFDVGPDGAWRGRLHAGSSACRSRRTCAMRNTTC